MEQVSDSNKKIVKNTLYMYLRMFVILIVSLFMARVVFNTLGVDNYGIYNVVGGIIVFFTFINEGLSNATRRYITVELAHGNIESQQRIFSIAIDAHTIIAFIIFLGGESIGLYFLNYVLNIPADRIFAANIVYQFFVLSAILGVMQAPFNSVIVANEKMAIYAYFSILDIIFKLLIIYLVQTIQGDKLIIYAILIFIVGVIDILIYRIYCYKRFPMCKYKRARDKGTFISMFAYMGWSLFGQGTYVLTNQGTSILINIYYNVAVNAALGVGNTIVNMVHNFISNFQVAFVPQITKLYISGNIKDLNKLVLRTSRYSSFLILIFLVPIFFESHDFLAIWLGKYPTYSIQFCNWSLICLYFESIISPLIIVINSDKDIKWYQIIISVFYTINVLLSWVFLFLGTFPYIVVQIRFVSDIFLIFIRLWMVKRKVEAFSIKQWLSEVILNSLLIASVSISIALILGQLNINNIWLRLFISSSALFISTGILIIFIGLNKREKELLCLKFKEKLVK